MIYAAMTTLAIAKPIARFLLNGSPFRPGFTDAFRKAGTRDDRPLTDDAIVIILILRDLLLFCSFLHFFPFVRRLAKTLRARAAGMLFNYRLADNVIPVGRRLFLRG